MTNAHRHADTLRALHAPGDPLVLPNAWDPSSARAVVEAGFPVVATSSGAVAWTVGREDHEGMSAEESFDAVARIASAVDVPVTADIESGYGLDADDLVARLVAAGAAGCNLEDTDHATESVRRVDDAAGRIAEVRAATERAGVPLVLNARVDVFLADRNDLSRLDEAIARGRAYLEAGADCTYPIALGDRDAIERYVRETGGAVNVLLRPGAPTIAELASIGVARISLGGLLHRALWARLGAMLADLREGHDDRLWSTDA